MKKCKLLSAAVLLAVFLAACTQSVPPAEHPVEESPSLPPAVEPELPTSEVAAPSQEEVVSTEEKETPGPQESEAPTYPWRMPEQETLDYEDFFAEERAYDDAKAPWYGYTVTIEPKFYTGSWYSDGEGYQLWYDGEGICFLRRGGSTPVWRVPNTKELTDSRKLITNTRQLLCMRDEEIICVDVLTGETCTLYTAEHISDMVLCHGEVLYILSVSNDVLCLHRSYLPTMTMDLLYAQDAPDVPPECYKLFAPESSESTVVWETISPYFWKEAAALLEKPQEQWPEIVLHEGSEFSHEFITGRSIHDESVQLMFARLQEEFGLRPRMRVEVDVSAGTRTETYGIYDVCFFGTGVHADSEHFAAEPEYTG